MKKNKLIRALLIAKELHYQFKQSRLLEILKINIRFLFGKKTVSFYFSSDAQKSYFIHSFKAFQADPNIQTFIFSRFQLAHSGFFHIKYTASIFFSHLQLCSISEIEYVPKTSFAKTVCFPHSLLSIFCEGKEAFLGFDYIICHNKQFQNELKIHLKETSTKVIPGIYERLIEDRQNNPTADQQVLIALTRSDLLGSDDLLFQTIEKLLDRYSVVFRPHPMDFEKNPSLLKKINEVFGSHPNFRMDASSDIKTVMESSSLLISDWSGSALHFAICYERPVVLLDMPFPYYWYQEHSPEVLECFDQRLENIFRHEIAAVLKQDGVIEAVLQEAASKIFKINEFSSKYLFKSNDKNSNYKKLIEFL